MNRLEALSAKLREICPDMPLLLDEPMSRHTTFRVGGPVKVLALSETEAQVIAAVRTAGEFEIVPFFLGNGSNLLVADNGYDGFLLKPNLTDISVAGNRVKAGAGALLSQVAAGAMEAGLSGFEFAGGIPGTVGGAIVMNAGAYGGEMRDVVVSVAALERNGSKRVFSGAECDFSYRHSVFSGGDRVILEAVLELKGGNREEIAARMAELAQRRRSKQPLEFPSGGSTFKRPAPVDGVPVYAAALIDQCGLKGRRVGGAQVSEKHAGFIVNAGGATCGDVLSLMELVKNEVYRQTGITLEPEIKTLGV